MGLIRDFLQPWGITVCGVPAGHMAALDEAIRAATNLGIVFIETPANPTMMMTDIRRAAGAAARHPDHPLVMVDNTFLGPTFQHPILLGADLVLYSATKYLSGFSDLLAGVALAADPALIAQMRGRRIGFGNILQPDECWMLDGRLPTVALRMNRQSKNAQRIAEKPGPPPRASSACTIPRCSTTPSRSASAWPSANSPAPSSRWSWAAATPPSTSSARSRSRTTPSLSAAWKRSPATPGPPRTPA